MLSKVKVGVLRPVQQPVPCYQSGNIMVEIDVLMHNRQFTIGYYTTVKGMPTPTNTFGTRASTDFHPELACSSQDHVAVEKLIRRNKYDYLSKFSVENIHSPKSTSQIML